MPDNIIEEPLIEIVPMTEEQIEKGLKCCSEFLCGECPYNIYEHKRCNLRCQYILTNDVKKLYEKLKEENGFLERKIKRLQKYDKQRDELLHQGLVRRSTNETLDTIIKVLIENKWNLFCAIYNTELFSTKLKLLLEQYRRK